MTPLQILVKDLWESSEERCPSVSYDGDKCYCSRVKGYSPGHMDIQLYCLDSERYHICIYYESAIELVKAFIQRNSHGKICRSDWLRGSDMEVYVRRSVPRVLNDGFRTQTFDIANVEVYYKDQGHFTAFLEEVHAINPWGATYVESVLDQKFGDFLLRQGFVYHKGTIPSSYYKVTEQNEQRMDV